MVLQYSNRVRIKKLVSLFSLETLFLVLQPAFDRKYKPSSYSMSGLILVFFCWLLIPFFKQSTPGHYHEKRRPETYRAAQSTGPRLHHVQLITACPRPTWPLLRPLQQEWRRGRTDNRFKSCNVAMLPSASIYRLLPSYFVIKTFVEIRSQTSDVHCR